MVPVAQLAEHLLVAQKVAGSSPVRHPSFLSQNNRFLSDFLVVYNKEFRRKVVVGKV
jgi:hypothetical protein